MLTIKIFIFKKVHETIINSAKNFVFLLFYLSSKINEILNLTYLMSLVQRYIFSPLSAIPSNLYSEEIRLTTSHVFPAYHPSA